VFVELLEQRARLREPAILRTLAGRGDGQAAGGAGAPGPSPAVARWPGWSPGLWRAVLQRLQGAQSIALVGDASLAGELAARTGASVYPVQPMDPTTPRAQAALDTGASLAAPDRPAFLRQRLLLLAEAGLRESGGRAAVQAAAWRQGEGPRGKDREARGATRPQGSRDRGDLGGASRVRKRARGALNGRWTPHDTRDQVVDYIRELAKLTELPVGRIRGWSGLGKGKYYDWVKRFGKANEHNATIPRDHWLTDDEKQDILDYHERHPLEGYRRLAFMMIDDDVVAVSPSSVYRVLRAHDRLDRWNRRPSKKGTGFAQPSRPHQHWHIDIAYINVVGTFYYLCSILDGCSRYIVHWEIHEAMKEEDVELIIQRAREKFPGEKPRLISDNGPQFIALDLKKYIRLVGMTHVRITPGYPQSNGKKERFYKTLKGEAIRVTPPESLQDARRIVGDFVDHYNNRRLHSAIGYITPADRLAGRQDEVWTERDYKLEAARELRRQRRQAMRELTQEAACSISA